MEKYYTETEIWKIFNRKDNIKQNKILREALKMGCNNLGSEIHCIAVCMGYSYSDMYNEPTWYKIKNNI